MRIFLICFVLTIASLNAGKFEWVKPSKENIGLPSSIEIYKLNTTNSPFGTNLTGAFARFDFTDPNL